MSFYSNVFISSIICFLGGNENRVPSVMMQNNYMEGAGSATIK